MLLCGSKECAEYRLRGGGGGCVLLLIFLGAYIFFEGVSSSSTPNEIDVEKRFPTSKEGEGTSNIYTFPANACEIVSIKTSNFVIFVHPPSGSGGRVNTVENR